MLILTLTILVSILFLGKKKEHYIVFSINYNRYKKGGIIMYYYGGYSGNSGCGCNNASYSYPMYGYGYTGGYNSGAAIVLVLFILLVIILGSRSFGNN